MTFTGKPGDPTVVSWGDSRLDMFARDVDDTLLHFWSEGWDEGSKSLGGILSGDPVAVALGPRRLHVFARGSGGVGLDAGGHLLHWWWSEAQGRMTGPETKPGWRLVHNPIAVVAGLDTIDVYARGAGDQLRRWRMKADILGEPEYLGMVVKGGLAAIYEVGVPDVFACGSDDRLVHYGQLNGAGGPEVWEEADGGYDGGAVIGTPAAVWTPSPHRFDVVGRTGDGSTLAHWGWSGSENSHAEPDVGIDHPGHWFGPGDRDSYAPLDGHCRGDPVMVAPGPKTPRGVRPRQGRGAAAMVMGRRALVTVPLLARTHAGRAQRTRVALRLQSGRAAPRGPDRAVRVGRRQGGGREREREAAAAARPEDVDVRHRRA